MKTEFFIACLVSSLFFFLNASPQTIPFSTTAFIDVNNIKAATLVHGDLWWNPSTQQAQCEFPKGSGKNIGFASALWMSGYDENNMLHVAAQTYRQSGNDYWPGPLDAGGNLTYATSRNWARIWKVNKTQIDSFLAAPNHTTASVPYSILQWPAKGNPYVLDSSGLSITITQDMAPFVDVNGDGVYNPLQGDYPAIKGDQALWWVFSDNGATHTESNGIPLKVEVHAMAYAFQRNNSSLNNVIYYEYTVLNKSGLNYHNVRIGLFADLDLGYAFDDFVGFDSTHRLGYIYNGASPDGSGQLNSYGSSIPIAGVSLIRLPGDAGNIKTPAGSFMAYNNDASNFGNPRIDTEYNHLLRSSWLDGTHLSSWQCPNTAKIFPLYNYMYPGDPSDTLALSECRCGNLPYDRRLVIASNDFGLSQGSKEVIVMALITTNPDAKNTCPGISLSTVKAIADTAWDNYTTVGVNMELVSSSGIRMFPNPARDKLVIQFADKLGTSKNILIYNTLGQLVKANFNIDNETITVPIGDMPSGVYRLLIEQGNVRDSRTFIKN